MTQTLIKLLLFASLLLALMGLLSTAVRRSGIAAETGRKLLHLGMGSIVMSFPWSIGSFVPVLVLAILSATWMVAVRSSPFLTVRFGAVLHAVDRTSWGEMYFAVGAGASYYLAGSEALNFVLPMALLTYADSAAAFAGTLRGKGRHLIGINDKSLEGCAAFFAVAVLCAFGALAVGSHGTPAERLGLSLQLAFDAMALEIIGTRGADNLLIPVGTTLLLPLLLSGSPVILPVHLVLAVVLLVLWRVQRPAAAGSR
jgi:phytol kinase